MKNKIIKWVVSLALGLVLTLAVSAITLLATTPVSTTIFMVIFFAAYFIVFYALIGKTIKNKLQSSSYGTVGSIACAVVLAAAMTHLSMYGTSIVTEKLYIDGTTKTVRGYTNNTITMIIHIIVYGILVHAIADKFDRKK